MTADPSEPLIIATITGPDGVGRGREPAMTTVTVWHNVATDSQGRHTAMTDGHKPGNPMVRVFAYQADPAGRHPEAVAEEAFAICNGHPRNERGEDLSRRYHVRELRSLSVGDVVAVGEVLLAVARAGWTLVRGTLNEVRTDKHGTHPWPAPAATGQPSSDPAAKENPDERP